VDDDIIKCIKMELYNYINDHINKISGSIYLHNGLQRQIAVIARKFGYRSVMEYKILNENKRNKYIDVVWIDKKNNNIMYAIEIDSSLKKGSIKKLNYIEAKNKIWILYCSDIHNYKFDSLMSEYNKKKEISIIYLGALRQYLRDKFKEDNNKIKNA
jgi:ribosomal protein L7Ae-like RNA K-turn-binding protein